MTNCRIFLVGTQVEATAFSFVSRSSARFNLCIRPYDKFNIELWSVLCDLPR